MRRSGFTLIEVLVALTIGGVVLLAAEGIFSGVASGSRQLMAARERLDREANGRRWLKSAFLSLEVGQASVGGFEGRVDRLRFSAWQLAPGGWYERRQIELSRVNGRLLASLGDAPLVLGDSVADVAFEYLIEPGVASRWVREWISPVSAPLAVRIRVTTGRERTTRGVVDTLLFLIKERG